MQAPGFIVEDADGRVVDDNFYSEHGEAVVAFFSDDCVPCQQVKAELARDPLSSPLLAFVHTRDGGPQQHEFAAELARVGARTVLLEPGSDMPKRFSIGAFPTLLRLRDGVVVASSIKLAGVRERAGIQ
jgi:thiol-disulfide isomerase/thioredoxin